MSWDTSQSQQCPHLSQDFWDTFYQFAFFHYSASQLKYWNMCNYGRKPCESFFWNRLYVICQRSLFLVWHNIRRTQKSWSCVSDWMNDDFALCWILAQLGLLPIRAQILIDGWGRWRVKQLTTDALNGICWNLFHSKAYFIWLSCQREKWRGARID